MEPLEDILESIDGIILKLLTTNTLLSSCPDPVLMNQSVTVLIHLKRYHDCLVHCINYPNDKIPFYKRFGIDIQFDPFINQKS